METEPYSEKPSGNEFAGSEQKKRTFLKRLVRIFIFSTVSFAGIIFLLVLLALQDVPPMTIIENPETELSTQIYSTDGKLIRSLYQEKHRISVRIEDISTHVFDALIATEDSRFYDHNGVDAQSFFAIIKDKLQGKKTRGGSTITMQLARNLYDQVGRKKSIWRKFKEMIVAVMLERKFTKEEIITAYLNTVSFTGNTYGLQNASRVFFQKDAKDLNVEESALLVGLLKGTGEFNPMRHPKEAKERRDIVLTLMKGKEFISEKECDSLKHIELALEQYKAEDFNTGLAPYFTEHLRLWLGKWCKKKGYNQYTDGLKVYTTIDSRMQRYAEESVKEHMMDFQKIFEKHITGKEPWLKDSTILPRAMRQSYRYILMKKEKNSDKEIFEEFNRPRPMKVFSWKGDIDTVFSPWDSLKYYSRFMETGFISIDPSNGYIKAWVGGIDHKNFKYDHVYTGKRQVGSTFKPFVYCAAFDNGWSPCDQMLNQPIIFKNNLGEEIWAPKNADGKVGGFMTLRQGLATSTNLITARVMAKIKPELVCQWAYRLGIQSKLDCVPSLALGTTDLSVQELVGAYCSFVNKGVWNEPIFVTRIEDRNGNILEEFNPKSRQAIEENTAYMMLDMLQGVVNEAGGTAGRLRFMYKIKHPIGGKTGTTQKQSDGWFVGVTPFLVSGAWVGCSDRSMRFRTLESGQGAAMALPIWGIYMNKIYNDPELNFPTTGFVKPRGFKIELDCKKYLKLKKHILEENDVEESFSDIGG